MAIFMNISILIMCMLEFLIIFGESWPMSELFGVLVMLALPVILTMGIFVVTMGMVRKTEVNKARYKILAVLIILVTILMHFIFNTIEVVLYFPLFYGSILALSLLGSAYIVIKNVYSNKSKRL